MYDQKRDEDHQVDHSRNESDGHGEEAERVNAFRVSHVDGRERRALGLYHVMGILSCH